MSKLRHLGAIYRKLKSLNQKLDCIERLLVSQSVEENRLYRRSEAARILGVSCRTVDRRIKNGLLNTVQRGGSVFITGKSLLCASRPEQRPAVEVLKI